MFHTDKKLQIEIAENNINVMLSCLLDELKHWQGVAASYAAANEKLVEEIKRLRDTYERMAV